VRTRRDVSQFPRVHTRGRHRSRFRNLQTPRLRLRCSSARLNVRRQRPRATPPPPRSPPARDRKRKRLSYRLRVIAASARSRNVQRRSNASSVRLSRSRFVGAIKHAGTRIPLSKKTRAGRARFYRLICGRQSRRARARARAITSMAIIFDSNRIKGAV